MQSFRRCSFDLVGLFCVLAVLSACRRTRKDAPAAESAAASSEPASLPPDRLTNPSELAAGTEDAFGLPLPRGFRAQRFDKIIFARGDASGDQVSAFVRRRVSETAIEMQASRTIFPRVTVKGQGSGRVLRVEIAVEKGRDTELVIRDVTPVALGAPSGSEDDRWRRTGVTPQGRLVDPNRTF